MARRGRGDGPQGRRPVGAATGRGREVDSHARQRRVRPSCDGAEANGLRSTLDDERAVVGRGLGIVVEGSPFFPFSTPYWLDMVADVVGFRSPYGSRLRPIVLIYSLHGKHFELGVL